LQEQNTTLKDHIWVVKKKNCARVLGANQREPPKKQKKEQQKGINEGP